MCMKEHTLPSSFWKSKRYACSCTLYSWSRISVMCGWSSSFTICLQRIRYLHFTTHLLTYSVSRIHSYPSVDIVLHTSIMITAASFLDCTPRNHRFARLSTSDPLSVSRLISVSVWFRTSVQSNAHSYRDEAKSAPPPSLSARFGFASVAPPSSPGPASVHT